MEAERDANLHQPVAELEQIWDANLPSLHFPLLFQHGELVGILEFGIKVALQVITTTEFHVLICCIPTLDLVQWVLIVPVCLVCSCHRAKAN